jgi:hypothetical protein
MDPTQISQPDIELFGIRILEPVTSITDIIVAMVCLYAYWQLNKGPLRGKTILFMKWYFLTMGLATFLGGMIGHGFLYAFDEHWKLLGWYISMISIALIERSAIEYAKPHINPKLGSAFLVLNIIELVILMAIVTYTLHFSIVEFHCVYGLMIVVFSFHLYTYLKTRDKGSKWILYAVGVLVMAAFVFNYPVVLDAWFNHRDLAHILMAIGSLMFLKAARNLEQVTRATSRT